MTNENALKFNRRKAMMAGELVNAICELQTIKTRYVGKFIECGLSEDAAKKAIDDIYSEAKNWVNDIIDLDAIL